VRYWDLEGDEHVERPIPGSKGSWAWEEDYRAAFERAVDHIVGILDETATNMSPPEAATESLETIVAFYLFHHTGSSVSVAGPDSLRDVSISSW
jgi:hypothetical protein